MSFQKQSLHFGVRRLNAAFVGDKGENHPRRALPRISRVLRLTRRIGVFPEQIAEMDAPRCGGCGGTAPVCGGTSPVCGKTSRVCGGTSPVCGGTSPVRGGTSRVRGGATDACGGRSPCETGRRREDPFECAACAGVSQQSQMKNLIWQMANPVALSLKS